MNKFLKSILLAILAAVAGAIGGQITKQDALVGAPLLTVVPLQPVVSSAPAARDGGVDAGGDAK
jgi:hypothetical protein